MGGCRRKDIEIRYIGNIPFFVNTATGEVVSDHECMRAKSYLSVPEVGCILRVSESMVLKLVRAGELSVLRVGASVRVYTRSLHDYIERHRIDK